MSLPKLRRAVGCSLVCAGLIVSACGSSKAAAPLDAARVSETTTTSTTSPATTTTIAPLAANEVVVAVARDSVDEVIAYDHPDGTALSLELPLRNPWYFGGELVLLVLEGRENDEWVKVSLPERPNGQTAWVRSAEVQFRTTRWHVVVSIGERMLRAYEGDALRFETPVVVGRASTPTPLGRFFINAQIVQANPGGAYGPRILSVSGYSETLSTFDGGIPTIGIHGTNQPSLLGSAASNGCIRMDNAAIEELAAIIPLGAPVEFVA